MVLSERTTHMRLAIEIVSDKWRIAVLHLLCGSPLRTSQLQRGLEEVSPKVLTQTLRGLERDGLVERKIHAVAPPRVEYRLTAMARELLTALDDLCRWSKTYGQETALARSRYDMRSKHSVSEKRGLRSLQPLSEDMKKFSTRLQAIR